LEAIIAPPEMSRQSAVEIEPGNAAAVQAVAVKPLIGCVEDARSARRHRPETVAPARSAGAAEQQSRGDTDEPEECRS